MEGEPVLKKLKPRAQKPTKLKLVPAKDVTIPMHVSLWYDLIFMRLSLVELIVMKRTCKTFAVYKKLQKRIKEKETAAFMGIKPQYRNKPGYIRNPKVVNDTFFDHHAGKFLIVVENPHASLDARYMLMACSSKLILLNWLKMYFINLEKVAWENGTHEQKTDIHFFVCAWGLDHAFFTDYHYIHVSGVDFNECRAYMLQK